MPHQDEAGREHREAATLLDRSGSIGTDFATPTRSGQRRLVDTLHWMPKVALLVLLFFVYAGDRPPMVNESHYLVKAKNFWDPQWCASDMLASSSKAHVTFYVVFGWLTKFVSLEATAWIGRLVGWTMLAFGLQPTQLESVSPTLPFARGRCGLDGGNRVREPGRGMGGRRHRSQGARLRFCAAGLSRNGSPSLESSLAAARSRLGVSRVDREVGVWWRQRSPGGAPNEDNPIADDS